MNKQDGRNRRTKETAGRKKQQDERNSRTKETAGRKKER
jgi:hypothetical protein